jgi:hypothetical protein
MVSLFSFPDPEIFMESSETVYLNELLSESDSLMVIPVTAIHSVISMFPEMCIAKGGLIVETGKFSLMHHAFLELAEFSNGELFDEEDKTLNMT